MRDHGREVFVHFRSDGRKFNARLGRLFTAQRAYEIGLINKVVPLEHLEEAALEYCRALLDLPPVHLGIALRMLRKAQIMGQTAFKDALKLDPSLWVNCENEWGQGPGYRDRVARWNELWFNAEPRQGLERAPRPQ